MRAAPPRAPVARSPRTTQRRLVGRPGHCAARPGRRFPLSRGRGPKKAQYCEGFKNSFSIRLIDEISSSFQFVKIRRIVQKLQSKFPWNLKEQL
jgi:hypothetical protein